MEDRVWTQRRKRPPVRRGPPFWLHYLTCSPVKRYLPGPPSNVETGLKREVGSSAPGLGAVAFRPGLAGTGSPSAPVCLDAVAFGAGLPGRGRLRRR